MKTLALLAMLTIGCGSVSPEYTAPPPLDTRANVSYCDIDCTTGALLGWYNVPGSCDRNAMPNPQAPDWYMNCDGDTYTAYHGGDWSCQMPQDVLVTCSSTCLPAKEPCP